MKEVLQKYIAQAGFCSRRRAEELIAAGRVMINGETVSLGRRVEAGDEVTIDGERISSISSKAYVVLNKPKGYTCTNRLFDGEKNIFSLIPAELGRLHVVGRLDKESRGLVLLSNDGDITQQLTHPSFEHEKEYLVKIKNDELIVKNFSEKEVSAKFCDGIDIGDGDGVVRARACEYLGENRFRVVLTEGKKRQIRRMFLELGFLVEDLQRVRIATITLGDLKEGEFKVLEKKPDIV